MSDEQHHPQRTKQQNKSIHVYFALVAEELNKHEKWLVVRVGNREMYRRWTGEFVKEHIWRPLQLAEFGEVSTTKLRTIDPSIVYDHVNKFLGEQFGIHVPFPDRFSQAERAAA